MTRKLLCTAGVLLCLFRGAAWGGEPRPIDLTWNELGPRIEGRKVALVLPGGTSIEGRVRGVEPDGLRLRVSKTSGRKLMPKGERLVPREAVSLLRLTEYRKLGRILTTLGAVGVAGAAVGASYPDINEGVGIVAVPAAAAAGLAGVAIAGYYAGKAIDRRVVEIRVVK